MIKSKSDEIDLQTITENVSFLADCFDNSFVLQSSLNYVKEFVKDIQHTERPNLKSKSLLKKGFSCTQRKQSLELSSQNVTITSKEKKKILNKDLKNWGLPFEIAKKYEKRGINEMFDWQVDCLANPKVLSECKNLVYSAPTSAGKTLVAEILTIKTVLERQKKVIIILPFVSIVREKMFYLQDILSSSGVRVEGFMGSQSPSGGLQAVHVAICTIEKANSLINKLLDEGNISELGAVVVDELHLLGDPHRGYILELLLTKIKYVSSKINEVNVQIVGMSATLPNLQMLADWLDAELFVTEFRPIPLYETCLVGNKYYDKNGKYIGKLENANGIESDYVLSLCLETLKEGCSILIFCMTKNRCENLSQSIATSFYKLGSSGNELGSVLREQLNSQSILETLEQLKNCPVGLDQVLKNVVSFGVAYHHAGLTFDERDIIEGAFKSGSIRVLVATSTLSSGVNLPARKVIIRSPVFRKVPINILSYKQMIGRAGRMGKDVKGESILICTQAEQKIGFELMTGNLDPVKSCIESEDKFMRAVLEMIASQDVCTKADIDLYTKCTLLFTQQSFKLSQNYLLEDTLKELNNFELIRIQNDEDSIKYVATSLGKACLSSSMAPNDGLSLFCELQKARQCLVLETDLHLIYLVTPYSVSSHWNDIDWLHLLSLWESLTVAMKRVGELVGVQESFIIRCLRGTKHSSNAQNKFNIHKRFYTALALQDLVNEVPLSEVASKFQCSRGFLQGLQQASSTFAGMVTAFCRQLGWKNMEMLISQFQDRLQFGIHSELLDLMKLPSLNGVRARTLFDAGFETIANIASAEANVIENILHRAVPFQSEKEREGDDEADLRKRKKIKNIWITGFCGVTAREAAENLILEARKYLVQEIGVKEIKWKDINFTENISNSLITGQNCGDLVENSRNNDNKYITLPVVNKTNQQDLNPLTEDENGICLSKNNKIESNYLQTHNGTSTPKQNNHEISKLGLLDINKISHNEKKITSDDVTRKTSSNSQKEEVVWETLNFTEAAFDNISKMRTSNNFFSPNISLSDFSGHSNALIEVDNNVAFSKNESTKDISLFSSDDSSIFEESLPIDLLPNTLIDNKSSNKKVEKNNITEFNLNSETIQNVFNKLEADIEEEENFKLVYEDDKRNSEDDCVILNVSQENEIGNTQDVKETFVKTSFISPLKRRFSNKKSTQSSTKKSRKSLLLEPKNKEKTPHIKLGPNSKMFELKIGKNFVNCFILRENDISKNFCVIENSIEMSLFVDLNLQKPKLTNVIGSNILDKAKDFKDIEIYKDNLPIRGLAIYLSSNICLYLDLISFESYLSTFKLRLIKLFSNASLKIRVLSTKLSYLHIKKWLGKDLLNQFRDVSLAEWLLDSHEKMANIVDLLKSYCSLDLFNTEISLNYENKSYNDLDSQEMACLNACCIWNVAEEQSKCLEKYQFMNKTLDTEILISKILANCEYYGITVDKDLASKLLNDVKNSQEVLQKKAFKLCGYHFNFNSSKDVAKVLGLYKGRKVSTKKSVLTAHNSTMASIVIYWRKLNSILTKTLYPLTHQACNYSEDNRISPVYTMHTCTGRISMHEPNLQNVPRTFCIPLNFIGAKEIEPCVHLIESNSSNVLNSSKKISAKKIEPYDKGIENCTNGTKSSVDAKDIEPCCDVLEFNCRNIFKSSPGYVFVSADYCQLEMRILTHCSGDSVLTNIMRSNVDVFKSIAASWSNVPEEEVDDDLRQKAKQLCYGILYGMGNRTLSQYLDVTEIEAAMFMDAFYKTYPAIKIYTQKIVDECTKNGYVETLMRRRRYLPDINSNVQSKRSAAERQAINTTIQGSAADIAKAAMCAIDTKTNKHTDKPRLVLQMHDELIYEVKESEKNQFIGILKNLMEDTVHLNVPLPVKVKTGVSWGAMEEIKI